jgi:hypothetical protein
VRDREGQSVAYVYFEEESGRRSAAKILCKDDAWRIASNIAKLPNVPRDVLKNIAQPKTSASEN